jgi:hypothetical protein
MHLLGELIPCLLTMHVCQKALCLKQLYTFL